MRLFPNLFVHSISALLLLAGAPAFSADQRLELAMPGDNLNETGDKQALRGWYSLSLNGDKLVLKKAGPPRPSDHMQVSGKLADKLFGGQALRRQPKPHGMSVSCAGDSLLLLRVRNESGKPFPLEEGEFQSALAPALLQEGWQVQTQLGGKEWDFAVGLEKRPDGKLLAGSLSLLGRKAGKGDGMQTLVSASPGMAFSRQDLLWLGDVNRDGEPDFLLKRSVISGEIEYLLVISPLFGMTGEDPDHPVEYSSSGVDPESNTLSWHKDYPPPGNFQFVRKGKFSISEEEWKAQLPDDSAKLPKLLAETQFKLNGETMRFTLEHLPRTGGNATSTSLTSFSWGGSVLLRVSFRGKSQVLTQLAAPNEGEHAINIGMIGTQPAVLLDYNPHYNNSMAWYWIYDSQQARFRRFLRQHSQGC